MMIVNHFLDVDILGIYIPDVAADSTTNAATGSTSIGAQADLCISTWGRSPNLMLVDNFNVGLSPRLAHFPLLFFADARIGDVFTAQDNLNHI
jgi:hypothetical protein